MDDPNDRTPAPETCGDFEGYTLVRFVLLACASAIALLGSVASLLLVFLFITRKCPNTPSTLYPTVLAVLDFLMCTLYIMLFGMDAAVVFLRVKGLFLLYHIYIVPAYVVSRITQLAIPYVLILGTLERFVWISKRREIPLLNKLYSVKGRYVTIIVSIACCVLLRIPTAFAVTVHDFPNCTDFFRSQSTGPAEWVPDSDAYYFFDFHLLSVAQTFVPFVVLFAFNFVIVRELNTDRKDSQSEDKSLCVRGCHFDLHSDGKTAQQVSMGGMRSSSRSANRANKAVRNAIYTMVGIVTSYLLSNSLHLILTILERSKSSLLRHPEDPNLASTFHTVFSDIVSFVYMFTSAIRVLIYYSCNPNVRADLDSIFATVLHCTTSKNAKLAVAV